MVGTKSKSKIVAVIDIGSLKAKFEVRLFDSELNSKVLYKDVKRTVLLKDLHKNGNYIIEQSVVDTVNAINEFKEKMKEYEVDSFEAVTTEAFRKANNANEVLNSIENETGIKLQILDARVEGEILFKSISTDFKEEVIAVIDVGSGSVQVVIGKNDKIFGIYSYPTGTYAWHEQPQDRKNPTLAETANEMNYVEKQLLDLKSNKFLSKYLVYGTTSVVDFFNAMNFAKLDLDRGIHKFYINSSDLKSLYKKITKLPYEHRGDFYPDDPYYMWGVDKAFMNVITASEYLYTNNIVPTNNNISTGILKKLAEKLWSKSKNLSR